MNRVTLVAAMLVLGAPASARAQETPTEREAARAVVQKQIDLQRSLNVDAVVAKLTGANPARDAVAARAKELMDKELLALGEDITRHPGMGFVEAPRGRVRTA